MPAAPRLDDLRSRYQVLWNSIIVQRGDEAKQAAVRIIAAKDRYQAVERSTGVPWFFVGLLHMRESNNNFKGVLHNGEHILGTGKRTRLVPAGRGPFRDWEEAALDAIRLKGLERYRDWDLGRIAFEAERFNGWGYHWKGIRSAYLWAGCNHEQPGKYVADHVWDARARDKQLGCMTVLKAICQMDEDVARRVGNPESPLIMVDAVRKADRPSASAIQQRQWIEDMMTADQIRMVQKKLVELNYDLKIDGIWGPRTRAAVRELQIENRLTVDGHYGPETANVIMKENKMIPNILVDVITGTIANTLRRPDVPVDANTAPIIVADVRDRLANHPQVQEMFPPAKPASRSATIVGAAISAAAALGGAFGYAVGPAELDSIVVFASSFMAFAGSVMAIAGRWKHKPLAPIQ